MSVIREEILNVVEFMCTHVRILFTPYFMDNVMININIIVFQIFHILLALVPNRKS